MNVQCITDELGRKRHVVTGLSCSTHDKTAAAWSLRLRQFLDALPDGSVVLCDPAYSHLTSHMVKTDAGLNGLYIREITIYIRLYY